jgi:hypothetical protein
MEHFFHKTIGEDWFTYPNLYSLVPKRFGEGARFVEVGVWKGRSISYLAVEVINTNKNQKIYAVDTWAGSEEHTDPNNPNYNPELTQDPDWLYNLYLQNIEPVKNIITSIRKPSLEAVNNFEDGSLDFVFIDAAHDYDNVKADILAWLPKVKKTGILAGHDYWPNDPVKIAVDELFSPFKIETPDHRTWLYDLNKWENE